MNFDHESQRACYERVRELMSELYGEAPRADTDAPSFGLGSGSAFVTVDVRALTSQQSAVVVHSTVITEAEDSEALHRYLTHENAQLLFGAFAVPDKGTVTVQHSILGDAVDKDELKVSVDALLQLADDYDDVIVGRFGGLRAVDRPLPG